jgi:uncharacterized membrane protein
MWKTTGTLIASAAAALILAGAVSVPATEQTEKSGAGKVMCEGVNECKGKGSCATAQNDCAGTNACKGKGAVSLSREECEKKGGKVSEKKM